MELNSTQVYFKMIAERFKEIQLSKRTIKINRINKVNAIKQTPENKNSSIIFTQLYYTNINRPQYSVEYYLYV